MQVEPVHRWVTGRGVTIALIDTGVDIDHPDLQGQVTAHRDFVISDSAGFNDDWHGTAVAGVMAALAHNAIGIVGIAPEAKLIALKACSAIEPDSLPAVCDSLSLAQAIDTAIRLQPDILNLSLTGPADPLLERLIDLATAQGIVVVTAQPEQPGRDVGFPASMENVIGVRRSGQSERGKPGAKTSVAAPGSEVLTTCPRGTYHFVSGSSLAAAHVSGIVALMLELKPKLTASAIVEVLRAAVDRGTALSDLGRSDVINVCTAIEILRGRPTCDRLTRQKTAPPPETHSNPETKLFSSGFEYTTLAARTPIAINQRH
jgi:subtilisin family serine protease